MGVVVETTATSRLTLSRVIWHDTLLFLGALRIRWPPKPKDEHNLCELKPGTPRRPGKPISPVPLLGSLPLQPVYFGLPHLALPNPAPAGRGRNSG
jgi:hypothetical protein